MTREEAIEVYNNLQNQKIKEAFEVFAPELRNSEDERIRKIISLALIASEEQLSAFYSVHNITRKECTDWLEKQKEPQQEWSEEDKETIDAIIRNLEYLLFDTICSEKTKENLVGRIKWLSRLKALPERFNLQPNQTTWSEEDIRFISRCVEILDKCGEPQAAIRLQELFLPPYSPSITSTELDRQLCDL